MDHGGQPWRCNLLPKDTYHGTLTRHDFSQATARRIFSLLFFSSMFNVFFFPWVGSNDGLATNLWELDLEGIQLSRLGKGVSLRCLAWVDILVGVD